MSEQSASCDQEPQSGETYAQSLEEYSKWYSSWASQMQYYGYYPYYSSAYAPRAQDDSQPLKYPETLKEVPKEEFAPEVYQNLQVDPKTLVAPIAGAVRDHNYIDYTVYGSFNTRSGKFQRFDLTNGYIVPSVQYSGRRIPDIMDRYFDQDKYQEEQGLLRSQPKKLKPQKRLTKGELLAFKRKKEEKKRRRLMEIYGD